MSSPENLGATLRLHREQRGITLKTVADQTKIGLGFLTALERGDCSKWPGGIYSRAWIRAYAAAIGLDPEDVAVRFTRAVGGAPLPEGQTAAPAPGDIPRITPPLRLTLAANPQERAHFLLRRCLLFVADIVMSAATAMGIGAFWTTASFWTVFGVAILTCHAIGLFGGGGSAAGWIDRSLRRYARPHENSGESPVAEAA